MAGLPNPNAEANVFKGAVCASANRKNVAQLASRKGKKRKRSQYNHCYENTLIRMEKCECWIGLTVMARKVLKELGRCVAYTTIWSIRSEYLKELREEAQDK